MMLLGVVLLSLSHPSVDPKAILTDTFQHIFHSLEDEAEQFYWELDNLGLHEDNTFSIESIEIKHDNSYEVVMGLPKAQVSLMVTQYSRTTGTFVTRIGLDIKFCRTAKLKLVYHGAVLPQSTDFDPTTRSPKLYIFDLDLDYIKMKISAPGEDKFTRIFLYAIKGLDVEMFFGRFLHMEFNRMAIYLPNSDFDLTDAIALAFPESTKKHTLQSTAEDLKIKGNLIGSLVIEYGLSKDKGFSLNELTMHYKAPGLQQCTTKGLDVTRVANARGKVNDIARVSGVEEIPSLEEEGAEEKEDFEGDLEEEGGDGVLDWFVDLDKKICPNLKGLTNIINVQGSLPTESYKPMPEAAHRIVRFPSGGARLTSLGMHDSTGTTLALQVKEIVHQIHSADGFSCDMVRMDSHQRGFHVKAQIKDQPEARSFLVEIHAVPQLSIKWTQISAHHKQCVDLEVADDRFHNSVAIHDKVIKVEYKQNQGTKGNSLHASVSSTLETSPPHPITLAMPGGPASHVTIFLEELEIVVDKSKQIASLSAPHLEVESGKLKILVRNNPVKPANPDGPFKSKWEFIPNFELKYERRNKVAKFMTLRSSAGQKKNDMRASGKKRVAACIKQANREGPAVITSLDALMQFLLSGLTGLLVRWVVGRTAGRPIDLTSNGLICDMLGISLWDTI